MGWIPNAQLVFRSKKQTGDYHDEMNAKHFEEWFEQQLMPNVPPKSVIVIDNAPYHNRVAEPVPTTSSTKAVMQQWLTKRGVEWSWTDLKRDLLEKIKGEKPGKSYVTDDIAERFGHNVIRTPVAHCELNPIELVWSKVKGYMRKNNVTFKLVDLERLVPAAFDSVTPDMWRNFCSHARKEEENFWKKDGMLEDAVDQVLVDLRVSDDEDEGSDSDSEEMDGADRAVVAGMNESTLSV